MFLHCLSRQLGVKTTGSLNKIVCDIFNRAVLRKLASVSSNSRWWIKGDGTDVTKGLWESVSGKWDGDIDLKGAMRCWKPYDVINKLRNYA